MRKTRFWIAGFFAFFAAVHFIAPAFAAPTLLDFEDIAPGTTVTAQYGPRGVLFPNHFLGTDPAAHSGTQVLRTIPPQAEVFTAVPLVMTFTSAQARVKLFAGAAVSAINGTLTAFDAGGNVVAQDGPRLVAADVFTTMFEVTVTTASITRAELRLGDFAHYAIDDLEFEGEPPGQVPTTPPVVQILSPVNGAEQDVDEIDITGTVAGEGLLPPVTVTVAYRQPPESTAPPITLALSLTGSGTTRPFQFQGFSGIPLGPITITATAENSGGLKGTATSTFTNLPVAIRDRFTAEGGAAAFGAFRFGKGVSPEASCRIAVYESGAISLDPAGTTRVIRGDILTKWLSLKGSFNETGFFGCPLGEERDRAKFSFEGSNWCLFVSGTDGPCLEPDVAGRVQDFTGGRIYNTTGIATYYVPIIFADVIDKRGGEAVTGVPMADPTSSVGSMETWLFQRFIVPELPKRLPSTIEIRGSPPRLYLERQSGHLIEPSNGKPLETTGTIWEHFPCDNTLGPCTVEPTPPQPEPIPNTGEFCFGGTVVSTILSGIGPRAWEPVLDREPFFGSLPLAVLRPTDPGNFISTPLFGVVTFAKLADTDLTLAHEWCYAPTWKPLDCLSDWIFRIRPYGAHAGAGAFGSLYGGTKDNTTVKIEYERFYSDGAIWLGLPHKGDLIFTAGRWVIDCGHDNYKTELHPIFMFSKMRTVTTLTDPFTGIVDPNPFGGTPDNPVPGTQADIWVNGWYPGDPIEFDIHPPPRPHPDATLVINKPVDAQAASGVSLTFLREPASAPSRAHIRFTAPSRHSEVTWLGEMKWQSGHGYQGQWYLYWKQ